MIHNHEVRSSILRPATRKRHHRILCGVFCMPGRQPVKDEVVYHESWLSMGYGRGRNAARHWHTKNIRKFSYAFLGNRHLRSKHGFIRRCEASTGASCDPLLLKFIENQALAEKSQMLFSCLCRSDPDKGKNLVGDHAF